MVGALAFFGMMSVAAAAAAAFPTACELGPAGYALACSQSWRETVVAGVLTANGLSAKYIENEDYTPSLFEEEVYRTGFPMTIKIVEPKVVTASTQDVVEAIRQFGCRGPSFAKACTSPPAETTPRPPAPCQSEPTSTHLTTVAAPRERKESTTTTTTTTTTRAPASERALKDVDGGGNEWRREPCVCPAPETTTSTAAPRIEELECPGEREKEADIYEELILEGASVVIGAVGLGLTTALCYVLRGVKTLLEGVATRQDANSTALNRLAASTVVGVAAAETAFHSMQAASTLNGSRGRSPMARRKKGRGGATVIQMGPLGRPACASTPRR